MLSKFWFNKKKSAKSIINDIFADLCTFIGLKITFNKFSFKLLANAGHETNIISEFENYVLNM